ncbi:MAG TPA: DUF3099 domain-containing protein [Jiangellaceae bacterium]|nr:DUF3099 domain-containing protein [Jiangellaceae bacterium]
MRTNVQSVTTARPGRSDDISARQRRYLWMMGIRIICVPFALLVDGWARWVFIVGAVVLPYLAVVVANAVARPVPGALTPVTHDHRPAIEAGPSNAGDTT